MSEIVLGIKLKADGTGLSGLASVDKLIMVGIMHRIIITQIFKFYGLPLVGGYFVICCGDDIKLLPCRYKTVV